MTPAEAREIAQEHIAWWRTHHWRHRDHFITCQEAWSLISPDRYPGGGWERVRALMIGWLLDNQAPHIIGDERGPA